MENNLHVYFGKNFRNYAYFFLIYILFELLKKFPYIMLVYFVPMCRKEGFNKANIFLSDFHEIEIVCDASWKKMCLLRDYIGQSWGRT